MYLSSKQRVSAWCCMALEKSIRTDSSKYFFFKQLSIHIQNKSDLQKQFNHIQKSLLALKNASCYMQTSHVFVPSLAVKTTAGLARQTFSSPVTKFAVRTNTKQHATNPPSRDTELTSCHHSWNLRITTRWYHENSRNIHI